MSVEYHLASGKTQAFFGLMHLGRYYFRLFAILSFIIAILSFRKKELKRNVLIAILLSVVSIGLSFTELWKYLI